MRDMRLATIALTLGCISGCSAISIVIPAVPFDVGTYGESFPEETVPVSDARPFVAGINGLGSPPEFGANIIGFAADQIGADSMIVVSPGAWPDIMDPIRDAYVQGRPIVIISYSLGNNNVIEDVLPILDSLGVAVTWVILDGQYQTEYAIFPAARAGPIPANVNLVVNIISLGPFNGRELVDVDFADADTPRFNIFVDADHFGLLSPWVLLLALKSLY